MESNTKKTLFITVVSILVMVMLLTVATVAWFTSNRKVYTNTASGKSGTGSLKFLIGPDEGSMVETTDGEVEIGQVNSEEFRENLLPVSTSDLETFWECTDYQEDKAVAFSKVEDESNYYHGRIYIRLEGENFPDGAKFDLYRDTSENAGGVLAENSGNGYLLNGSRLGLNFEDAEAPVIFTFEENGKGETKNHTVIDGELIASGNVIGPDGKAVNDPAVELSAYSFDSSDTAAELPEESVATVEINKTVQVDVYYYLEGCDEDCIDELSKMESDIHLAFYAVAASEE